MNHAFYLEHDANNGMLQTVLGPGSKWSTVLTHNYTDGKALRMLAAAYDDPTGDPATDVWRDQRGRILRMTEEWRTHGGADVSRTLEYEYDGLGRLSKVTELYDGDVTQTTFEYDDNGNRLAVRESVNGGAVADVQSVAALGKLDTDYLDPANDGENGHHLDNALRELSTSGPEGTIRYDYNPLGQLTRRSSDLDVRDYEYDAFGNLLSVTWADGSLARSYQVDARGRRVAVLTDGVVERRYLYRDELNPIAELTPAGALAWRYVYASKTHVPELAIDAAADKTYRVLSDHLGSVRALVDVSDGSVLCTNRYSAWGELVEAAPTTEGCFAHVPFGFAGGIYDVDTELYRFGARDYDPQIGRWTAKDPIRLSAGPRTRARPLPN